MSGNTRKNLEATLAAGNTLDLMDLMEVVTVYKCRFCSFTCSSTHSMANHLNNQHVAVESNHYAESDGLSLQEVADEPANTNVHVSTPASEVLNNESELVPSSQTTTSPDDVDAACVMPAGLDNAGLAEQLPLEVKSVPLVAASQPGLFTIASGSNTQALGLTTIQFAGPGLSLASNSGTVSLMPASDNTKDLGMGPASIAPVVRELFLCGMCSVGFTSVEDCKWHVDREHNAAADLNRDSAEVEAKGRVSVGTQATAKRPGRKKKSELASECSSPQVKLEAALADQDQSDEDWIPGRSHTSRTRDGRQRRKIRAPRALKEDYVIVKKRKYRKHRQVYKEHYGLSCSFMGCAARFRSEGALNIHVACHNVEDTSFTCQQCQQPFVAWKPLRLHLWKTHSVDADLFQCDTCAYKTDTLHKLSIHQEIHSDSRPYTCDVCGKGFKQLSQMKNHQITHAQHQHSLQGGWFSAKTCDICKRTFANSKCLKKHVEAVHSKVKPFACTYCSHTTARKAMLNLHMRIHTGEKPFKCDVCNYSTGDHNSLRRHKMRHTGQRQYKCQLCPYTCIQTISLKSHMRTKHPTADGIYTCPVCKFRSVNKQIYDSHLHDHHHHSLQSSEKLDQAGDSVSSMQPPAKTDRPMATAPEAVKVQMQVQTMESGEVQVSAEDLAKLSGLQGLASSEISAAQLIYSALSVISQGGGSGRTTQTAQLLNGIQTTVTTCSQESNKEGVSSHTITFHLPAVSISDGVIKSSDGDGSYRLLQEYQGVQTADGQDTCLQTADGRGLDVTAEQDGPSTVACQDPNIQLYTQTPRHLTAGAEAQDLVSNAPAIQVMHVSYTDESTLEDKDLGKLADGFSKSPVVVSKPGRIIQGMDGRLSRSTVVLSETGHVIQGMDGVLVSEDGQVQSVVVAGQVFVSPSGQAGVNEMMTDTSVEGSVDAGKVVNPEHLGEELGERQVKVDASHCQ